MAPRVTTMIDALEAPEHDGELLIWPEPESLAGRVEANRRLRQGCEIRILDRPLREWLSDSLSGPPIVMVGHQPAFFHPGILAKNFVADALSRRWGGRPQYLVVDSDAARGLALAWPEFDGDQCRSVAASAINSRALTYEQLQPMTADNWRSFFEQIPKTGPIHQAGLARFTTPFLQASNPGDFVSRWLAGVNSVEVACGVAGIDYGRVSQLFDFQSQGSSRLAAALTAHIVLAAPRFAGSYNASLAAYRNRRSILGSRHPIPDLDVEQEKNELPFWVISGGAPRRRLWAAVNQDRVDLFAGDDRIGGTSRGEVLRDPAGALRGLLGDLRIRPRALALTLFARMFLCDLFIHGIGGAKYDQITDEIAMEFFGAAPPTYACATATLRLPVKARDLGHEHHIDADRLSRDIRFNPQRYLIDPSLAPLRLRREQAISESDLLRRQSPGDRVARREAYNRIQAANAAYHASAPERVAVLRAGWESCRRHRLHNLAALSREWFFAFYSTEALTHLAVKARAAIGDR